MNEISGPSMCEQVNKKTFTKMTLEVGKAMFTNTSAKSIETRH